MTLHDRQKWDRLAQTWRDAGPPATPSQQDVENFATLIARGPTPGRAIILGCTPALRKLIRTRWPDCDTACVDFSTLMYDVTSSLLDSNRASERFIVSDWIDLDVGDETADVVLGDKAIDNVHPRNWMRFFEAMHRALRPSGSLIVHMAFPDLSLKTLLVPDALAAWASRVDSSKADMREAVSGLWEDLLTASAFYSGGYFNTVCIARYQAELSALQFELGRRPGTTQAILLDAFLQAFGDSLHSEWSSYTLDEIASLTHGMFQVDGILHSDDYAAAPYQPIVRLRRT